MHPITLRTDHEIRGLVLRATPDSDLVSRYECLTGIVDFYAICIGKGGAAV